MATSPARRENLASSPVQRVANARRRWVLVECPAMTGHRLSTLHPLSIFAILLAVAAAGSARQAAGETPLPLRQSKLTTETAGQPQTLTLRDASRNDRWLGLGVRDVRWSLDGEAVYFRWNLDPQTDDDPDADPWFRVSRDGTEIREVELSDVARIPAADPGWSRDGMRAAWIREGTLFVYSGGAADGERIRAAVSTDRPCSRASISRDGTHVHFTIGEDLYRYGIDSGVVQQISRVHRTPPDTTTKAGEWLKTQQLVLFDLHRKGKELREAAERRKRLVHTTPQAIPIPPGETTDNVRISPDGRFLVFRSIKKAADRPPTRYMDFASESGYAEVHEARAKVGEPQDTYRMGIVRIDPSVAPDDVAVVWLSLAEADGRETVPWGPYWDPESDRAVIQVISADAKDCWIADLDLENGGLDVIVHNHEPEWLGGPPIQPNYILPGLLEWIPSGRFVYASESGSGWSHRFLVERDGAIRTLTSGAWEVRDAVLTRDRLRWLITASREHPSDDHLYTLPAAGGELVRLSDGYGRHNGVVSPDGERLAVVSSDTLHLPDLHLRDFAPESESTRVTVSGSDRYYRHPLARPEIVSFPHTDGRPLWAALFKPEQPNPERAAVLHIHGGGYRQFSHRGWSVYGYALHLAGINYLVQQGYTVLDFDYRGSAGFGRRYRTDIYRSMGIKDIDGMVTAARYLEERHGIDPSRVGVYGISYGGFATLMALFRHPGVFAAGVANAAVTDWAHYSHEWTSRILNQPADDPEAYEISSPINHAEGLDDPLLIVHGLIDDNVHFQDVARLFQKLIEFEKDFEVMIYPVERHVIETEASRYDYMKRLTGFFDEHLLRR